MHNAMLPTPSLAWHIRQIFIQTAFVCGESGRSIFRMPISMLCTILLVSCSIIQLCNQAILCAVIIIYQMLADRNDKMSPQHLRVGEEGQCRLRLWLHAKTQLPHLWLTFRFLFYKVKAGRSFSSLIFNIFVDDNRIIEHRIKLFLSCLLMT